MIPVCFEYVATQYCGEKVFVTILNQLRHHYTGKTVYYVREESEEGWICLRRYDEETMQFALSKRVTEADK